MSGLIAEVSPRSVRDHLWLWGHQEGSHNGAYGLPGDSRMTPAEAAFYLGIPNMMMVCYGGQPEPPFEQYAKSLQPLKRLIWSVVGDESSKRNDEESDLEAVLSLAKNQDNVVGGILDDFFFNEPKSGELSRYDLPELLRFRENLHSAPRPLDLWVVLYNQLLELPVEEHLAACDGVTFWTWTADQLANLEQNFSRAENLIGNKRKMLGCYLWDFGRDKEMPLELMQRQCETGLRWLHEGRIEGMVFLASCICDLNIEAVEWTRDWITRVGEIELSK
jgi:hypothetical protein